MRRREFLEAIALAGLATGISRPLAAAEPALVAAARKEGELTWYSTLIINQLVRPLAQAFEQQYGIRVHYSRSPAVELALKLRNEIRAQRVRADVFDANAAFFQALPLDQLLPYSPPNAAAYPAALKDPAGRYHAVNVFTMTAGVNTRLVPPAARPKTYADLLDPRWKGKMAWTTDLTPNGPPGFIGNILISMGEDRGMAYLKQLATQGIANVPASQRVVLNQVIAGQYPLALMIFNYHAVISAARGAPVTWLPIPPVVSTANYMGIIKHSPHPNAAKLFIDFVLSVAGQKVFQAADYLPADPAVPAADPDLKPEQGHYAATVITAAMALEHLPQWTAVYKDLFQ